MWLFSAVAAVLYAPFVIGVIAYSGFRLTQGNSLYIAGSIILHLLYFLLLFKGYRIGDLSVVYPISRGSAPMMTTICAIFLLNEELSALSFAGVVCIVVGIFLLTGGVRVFRSKENLLPIAYGLLIGITISGYTLLDKAAVSIMLISPLLLDYFNGLGRLILLTPIAVKQWDRVKDEWRTHRMEAIGVGILNALGYILVLTAMTFTPVSYVAPLREISILFGTLLGARLLGEKFGLKRAAYASVIVAGVLLIAFTSLM